MIVVRLFLLISLVHSEFLFFERDSYEFYISESAPTMTKIGTIRSTSSSSLKIQYRLHGDTNKNFYLDSSTAELFLSKPLDYESIALYKLTIEAFSSSSSVAPSFSEILVNVVNTNDNPPDLNLVFYPSILFETNLIKYDSYAYSTSIATINIKDLDESTENLTLSINDTEHFQIQFLRQRKTGRITESIYILSTKNNRQLIEQENYYLSLHACDNDRPLLWTNQSYQFRMKPNENLCQFVNLSTIDIKENLPNRTLISNQLTNQYCLNMNYSIDDTKNFYIDSRTGFLYTSTHFNRIEQSIYKLNIQAIDQYNKKYQRQLTIRLLDDFDRIPFLTKKKLRIDQKDFSSIDLFNSTFCRFQGRIYNSFRLLTNCTLVKISLAVQGNYLFSIELNEKNNYEDTFLLELTSNYNEVLWLTIVQSEWIFIVPILLGIFFIIMIIICSMMIIRKRKYNKIFQPKPNSSSSLNNSQESLHYSKSSQLISCQLF